MTTKKSSQANLENKKSLYLMIGFVLALSLFYVVLEWSKKDVKIFVFSQPTNENPEEILIPITMIAPPPPPPPPMLSPEIINIVDDDIQTAIIDFTSEIDPNEGIPVALNNIEMPVEDVSGDPVIFAEVMPRFNGDVNEYLSKNINYPQIAIETYTQGKVLCQFVVNTDGSIENIEIVKSVDRSLDKEAIRVIKSMPKWRPGIQNGKLVRVKFFLQVNFKLM